MVLADLGRKITSALRSLSNATIINEEVTDHVTYLQRHHHLYDERQHVGAVSKFDVTMSKPNVLIQSDILSKISQKTWET